MVLGWDASPGADSYDVLRGGEIIATVTTNQAALDLPTSDFSTLVVVARNAAGASPESVPLVVQPLQVQHSGDLTNWESGPWFFAAYSRAHFVRLKFLTPTKPPRPTITITP